MIISIRIPGMCISREDIALIVYQHFRQMDEFDAEEKVNLLTDVQMNYIADEFAEEFFSVNDGLFAKLLLCAVERVEEDEAKVKKIVGD